MQIVNSSEITVENMKGKIAFDRLPAENLKLVNLEGNSGECTECLHKLKPGDRVVVFMISEVDASGEIQLPVKHAKLCHIYAENGNFCLEDFINRVLQGYRDEEDPVLQPVSISDEEAQVSEVD